MIVYVWSFLPHPIAAVPEVLVSDFFHIFLKKRHSSLSFFCFKEDLCLFRLMSMCVQAQQTWRGRKGHENPWAGVTGSHEPTKMEEQAALLPAEPSLQPQLICFLKTHRRWIAVWSLVPLDVSPMLRFTVSLAAHRDLTGPFYNAL